MPITLISALLTGFGAAVAEHPAVCRIRWIGGVSDVAESGWSASPHDARGNQGALQAVAPLRRLIEGRADAPPLLRRVLLSMACALALGLAGSGVDGRLGRVIWFAVPVVAAIGVLVLGWVEPQSARRRRRQLIMEVPQALELMAACLGAGVPARTACAAVVRTFDGPVADDLGQVMALLQLGVA